MDSSICEINPRSKNTDSAQSYKLLGLVCGFCLHALLRLYHLLHFGIPKADRRLTALLFDRIFYYSYLILCSLAGRRKNFTLNSQLLICTGFNNCKMPFQSGNLSGRNNSTGLDTFQPPLSLDGGPDVLLDYFSLYAAFSFASQLPRLDAFTLSQISLLVCVDEKFACCTLQTLTKDLETFLLEYL